MGRAPLSNSLCPRDCWCSKAESLGLRNLCSSTSGTLCVDTCWATPSSYDGDNRSNLQPERRGRCPANLLRRRNNGCGNVLLISHRRNWYTSEPEKSRPFLRRSSNPVHLPEH